MEQRLSKAERIALTALTFLMVLCVMVLFSLQAKAEDADMVADKSRLFKVMPADAELAIQQAMQEQGIADSIKVKMTSAHEQVLFSHNRPVEIGVKTLRYDEKRHSWSGNLFVFEGERVLSALPISGRYETLTEVPVLKTKMRQGDIIAKDDVEFIDYPEDKIRQDTASSAAQLIGMTPGRSISPGRPVRMAELQEPFVIQKNKQVEMRFNTTALLISALGESLEPGAVGQYIRVRNLDSNNIVHARVVSADLVEVRGAAPLAAAKVASRE